MISFLLASVFNATPMGPGKVPFFDRTCDRLRIYDAKTSSVWILCINGVYHYPEGKPPIDRSLPRHRNDLA